MRNNYLLVLVGSHHFHSVPQPLLRSRLVLSHSLLLRLLHRKNDLQLQELFLLPLFCSNFGGYAVENALLLFFQSFLTLGPGTVTGRDGFLVPLKILGKVC